MAEYNTPSGFSIKDVIVDGNSIKTMCAHIAIFENIYTPSISCSVVVGDTHAINWLENYNVQGGEDVEITLEDSFNNSMKFVGYLNGVRNRVASQSQFAYTLDIMDKGVKYNEQNFITKRFKFATPEDVVIDCLRKIKEHKIDFIDMGGVPMNFIASRWKPFQTIEYALIHGLRNSSGTGEGEGSGGFFFWATHKGYRGCPISFITNGKVGKDHGRYYYRLAKVDDTSFEEKQKSILSYSFVKLGDMFEKLRMGSYSNTQIVFNVDTGEYKEIKYTDDSQISKKHKDWFEGSTRYFTTVYANERFNDACKTAPTDQYDHSTKTLQQGIVSNGLFHDKVGEILIPLNFAISAGDRLELVFPKTKQEGYATEDSKFSGNYSVVAVGHHVAITGEAYSKLSILRSEKQQDAKTS